MKNLIFIFSFILTITFFSNTKDFNIVSIEEVKNFWNNRPCNIKHSLKPFGSKEYFEEVEKRKYFVEPHILSFAEFEKWHGKHVLEIGCGIGTEAINFVKNGAIYTAIELSEKSLDITKKRFQAFNLKGNLILGNAEEIDNILNQNEKFDLIWSFGVIHHSPNPEKILEKCKKFLKDDGEIRIMVYSKISYKLFSIMKETGMWDFSLLDELISTYSEAQTGCPITYSYTLNDIKKLFKDFKIISIDKTHIFPWNIQKYIEYKYEKENCFKNVSDELFKEIESELGWHILVIAKNKNNKESCE